MVTLGWFLVNLGWLPRQYRGHEMARLEKTNKSSQPEFDKEFLGPNVTIRHLDANHKLYAKNIGAR